MRQHTLVPLVLVGLLALSGCQKPVPPTYELAEGAVEVTNPGQLSLSSDLASLDVAAAALVQGPDGSQLRFAYDGVRLVGEVRNLSGQPDKACPLIVYLASGAGSHRNEFRFDGESATLYQNGSEFGGRAPRTQVAGSVYRFYLPVLGGDAGLHVEAGCKPIVPTVTAHLTKGGGLRYAEAQGTVIVGARAADASKTGTPGVDSTRYLPNTHVVLVGTGLDQITELRFSEESVVTPQLVSPRRLSLTTPVEGGTDSIVPVIAKQSGPSISLQVEGSIDRLDDAMGSFAGSIWGTWLVILLVGSGLILTIVNGFPQFRGFKHAISVIRGRYDNPDEKGEISHFQALTAALSATVGLGNIAGVAVAVTNGGPGAIFWMWVCGFLGMATKYSECTLSTATRDVREDGTVAGGPMYYMWKELHRFFKPMAFVFAIFITIASFGGGNMFQANQAAALWSSSFGVPPWVTGLILVGLVGLVIVGGIKRIGRVTDKLVPTMCGLYVLGALAVIGVNIERLPEVFGSIFTEAFSVSAAVGGVLGATLRDVMVQGFRRAAFSNEAGFGSAAIAHAAVKTDEPVREGVVALLEPFIDTIVICTMTGLVILFSGMWTQQGLAGAPLTAAAFDSAFDGFGSLLVPIAVFLFAISTMISWSYYGEKGIEFVFGRRAVLPYRIVFVGLIFIGSIWGLDPVLNFSDGVLGLVAVPNLIAVLLLTPKLRRMTKDYFGRLRSGEMKRYK